MRLLRTAGTRQGDLDALAAVADSGVALTSCLSAGQLAVVAYGLIFTPACPQQKRQAGAATGRGTDLADRVGRTSSARCRRMSCRPVRRAPGSERFAESVRCRGPAARGEIPANIAISPMNGDTPILSSFMICSRLEYGLVVVELGVLVDRPRNNSNGSAPGCDRMYAPCGRYRLHGPRNSTAQTSLAGPGAPSRSTPSSRSRVCSSPTAMLKIWRHRPQRIPSSVQAMSTPPATPTACKRR